MKFLTKIYYVLPLILAFPVYSAPLPPTNVPSGSETSGPPPGLGELAPLIDKILGYLFPVAGLIALVFIIQGGYMWIISSGDPSRVKQAQGTLTWAIIGLIVISVIFAVLRVSIDFLSK